MAKEKNEQLDLRLLTVCAKKVQSRRWDTCFEDTGIGKSWVESGFQPSLPPSLPSHFVWGLGKGVMTAVQCAVPKDCCTEEAHGHGSH